MTKELQEYLQTVQECLQQCVTMLEQEQSKRRALLGRDGKVLESAISSQQANIMQLENIERKRLAAQEKAGFSGQTANQMLKVLSEGEEKEAARKLFQELRDTVRQLQDLNQEALKIAQSMMEIYEQAGLAERRSSTRPTYQKPGQAKQSDWSSFEREI